MKEIWIDKQSRHIGVSFLACLVLFRQNSRKTTSIWRQNALFSGFCRCSGSLAVSGCHHERMRRAFHVHARTRIIKLLKKNSWTSIAA